MSKLKPDQLVDPGDIDSSDDMIPEPSFADFVSEMFQETVDTVKIGDKVVPSAQRLHGQFNTKSARIRYLYTEHALTVKEISTHLNIRYQMVRNILTNELKRGPAEPFTLGEKGGLAPLLLPGKKS